MTDLRLDYRQSLRNASPPAGVVVPRLDDILTATDGLAGRPSGAAYGRPFRRPGRVTACTHHQCWESQPLLMTMELGERENPDVIGPYVSQLHPEARRAFVTYRPQIPPERWAGIRPFVEDAVAVVAPACYYLAERVLVMVSHFVDWVVHVCGYAAKSAVVFNPVMIRRYVSRTDVTLSDKTRRDIRSFLLRVSEVLCPDAGPLPFAALNGQSVSAPYTDLELSLLEAWARGQSTALRRRGAGAILSLCSGAGLGAYEVQHLRHSDIRVDGNGILVTTPGSQPRVVPLLKRWEPLLIDSLRGLGQDALVLGRGRRDTTFNVVTPFLRKTSRSSEPDPMTARMRTTWLTTHLAARTPGHLLMAAAGLTKRAHLVGLLTHVPDLDNAEDRRRVLTEARQQPPTPL